MTTETQDVSYEEAFAQIASDFDRTGTSGTPGNSTTTETPAQDTSGTTTTETESQEPADDITSQDKEVDNVVDYQKLYEKLSHESRGREGLLYNRLNDLSDKYKNLLDEVDNKRSKSSKDDDSEMPASVKELFELYPEIATGMKEFVESKLKSVEKVVEQRVAPVQQHISQMTQSQHTTAIMKAHPDVGAIVESGKLDNWVQSLDPVKQAGAKSILQFGDSDSVIALLNDFKGGASSTTATGTPSNKTQSNKSTKQTSSPHLDEELVKRVLSAIGHSSDKGGVNLVQQKETPNDYASLFNMYAKDYEDKQRSRR